MALSLVQRLFITAHQNGFIEDACSKQQGIFDRKEVCHFQIRSLTPAATRLSSSESSCGECARFRGSRCAFPAFARFPLSFSDALVSKGVKDKLVRVKAHENGPNDM
jgi:hypothetical protein